MVVMGEWMHCFKCRAKEKSDPDTESGWTTITLNGASYYFCSGCFEGEKGAYDCTMLAVKDAARRRPDSILHRRRRDAVG